MLKLEMITHDVVNDHNFPVKIFQKVILANINLHNFLAQCGPVGLVLVLNI